MGREVVPGLTTSRAVCCTAPLLLGVGSLLFSGRRWAGAVGLAYAAFAVGVVVAMPVRAGFGAGIPAAQDHIGWLPRVVAIAANSLGTSVVVLVSLATLRARPLGNALIIGGVAVAAAGSGLSGLGVAGVGGFVLVAAVLLYLGVAGFPGGRWAQAGARRDADREEPPAGKPEPVAASVGRSAAGTERVVGRAVGANRPSW